MIQSHVVEISGTFVGAAISTGNGFRFRALHLKVEELDDSVWRTLEELRGAVRTLFTTGRLGAKVMADPLQSAASAMLRASSRGAGQWME